MLILTRRIGETLVIGDNIRVTVLGVKGQQVRLGTTAPREIAVHRQEIADKIADEAAAASEPRNVSSFCTVCHANWVDTEAGFDTCEGCLNAA